MQALITQVGLPWGCKDLDHDLGGKYTGSAQAQGADSAEACFVVYSGSIRWRLEVLLSARIGKVRSW
jgi:hypothetical protein